MEAAKLVAIFVSLFSAFAIFAFALSGKQWKIAEDQARERRLAEHRMNARLLRLNI